MIKNTVSLKDNVALLAKIFNFLNELDEHQVDGLLNNKAKLSLDTQTDGQLNALIDEKLNAKIDEKLSMLLNKKFSDKSAKNNTDSLDNATFNTQNKTKITKKDNAFDKGKNPGAIKNSDASAKKSSKKSVIKDDMHFEAIASEIKNLASKESIIEYFEKNPLKISAMKSLANKHFGMSGTRKLNVDSLIDGIIETVTN